MYKLIQLECKKFKFHFISKGTILTILILLTLMIFFSYIGKVEDDHMCNNVSEWIVAFNIFSVATFVIYGSTVLSKLVISEYRTKTIQLMFMYPVNRKKLLVSKTFMVYAFTVINVLLSDIVLIAGMWIAEHFIDTVQGEFSIGAIIEALPFCIVCIISSGFMAVAPLYFGMRKKSTVHTIIAAVFVVICTCSGTNSMALPMYFIRIIIIGGVAAISVMLTIFHTLNRIDQIEMEE